jgi:Uma2 family endonuclease
MTSLKTQTDLPLSPRQTMPTMYDLPSENPEESGLPDEYHQYQPLLLRSTFKPVNVDPDEIFIGTDINLYYDANHFNWYKRPDWFAVVGVSRLYEGQELRNSYVIWQESISPLIVVELLSPGTEDEDLGRTIQQRGNPPIKWQVYEQILRIPYYIVFSRYTNELQVFRLIAGVYERANLTDGRLLIPQLGLSLGLWSGSFENINRLWLRWFTLSGELILTPSEKIILVEQKAAIAQQEAVMSEQKAIMAESRAKLAEEKAQKLAAKLRELNINPDEID